MPSTGSQGEKEEREGQYRVSGLNSYAGSSGSSFNTFGARDNCKAEIAPSRIERRQLMKKQNEAASQGKVPVKSPSGKKETQKNKKPKISSELMQETLNAMGGPILRKESVKVGGAADDMGAELRTDNGKLGDVGDSHPTASGLSPVLNPVGARDEPHWEQ